jgi:hypothetical protein
VQTMTNSLLIPALHSGEACGRTYLSHEPSGWSSRGGRAAPRGKPVPSGIGFSHSVEPAKTPALA